MFGFIGNIGPWELILVLLIALIVIGPGKLPDAAKSLGKAVTEFRKSSTGVKKEVEDAMKFEDPPEEETKTSENKDKDTDKS
ncbi:Twin-arginine translocation protein TatA [Candidatus Syntrophocurvum alkaliphilum]|uniref:Sec-independent protein translocase protein TatA n=1 Tax=Candidatus Syntrophocurvum alkaliphilum TaxID=2293317 RepID=A0A6I6DG97_9FIRM|nr:Sec-independent protein translocase protein TatB [Candidatus Syntrophocurvum alkaliphilum]QGT99922.1 Twin-arginine translocation protein TatA [Candidatus Syntrophocurvum alkaliphilum]